MRSDGRLDGGRTGWWPLAWGCAALAALVAATPWAGWFAAELDPAAALLPLTPPLALAAAVIDRGRSRATPLAGLALVLATVVLVPELVAAVCRPVPAQGRPHLRVVTHNLAVDNVDAALTARVLLATDADILLLQETDGRAAAALPMLRSRYPYGSRCLPRCSLAILSRWPTSRARYRLRDAADRPFGPALVGAVIRPPSGLAFRAITLHLSRHRTPRGALRERRALAAALDGLADPALIVGGDFNLTPWGGPLHRLDAALAPLRRATRALASWPARWQRRTAPVPLVPIDHVYAGPRWRVARTTRLPRTGSDHYPIAVDLVWQP